jgi:hypothetical protein
LHEIEAWFDDKKFKFSHIAKKKKKKVNSGGGGPKEMKTTVVLLNSNKKIKKSDPSLDPGPELLRSALCLYGN